MNPDNHHGDAEEPEHPSGWLKEGEATGAPTSTHILCCNSCNEGLQNKRFVQCPSIANHKFCFACSKQYIEKQGQSREVYCPSGEKCIHSSSTNPWALMPDDIGTILGKFDGAEGIRSPPPQSLPPSDSSSRGLNTSMAENIPSVKGDAYEISTSNLLTGNEVKMPPNLTLGSDSVPPNDEHICELPPADEKTPKLLTDFPARGGGGSGGSGSGGDTAISHPKPNSSGDAAELKSDDPDFDDMAKRFNELKKRI